LEKDNQTLRPALAIGPSCDQIQARPLTVGQGAIGQTAATGKPAILNSTDIESEIPDFEDKYLLCAPLSALKGTIGLMVASRASTPFSPDDLRFFESLVQQASSAINNARLFEETQRSLSELALLYDASTAISTDWNDQDVLNTLIEKMVEAIGTNKGFIVNWNKNQNTGIIQAEFSKNRAGSQQGEALLGKTFNLTERPALLAAVNQQRPVFFNLSNPALDETERKAMEKHGCFSRLLVPLITKGEAIGWTELWDTQQPRVFTANEVRMSRALSSHIAVALENAQYLKQTQQTLEETTALYRVASALANTQDPQTIISAVLQEYLQALSLKQDSVVIFDFNAKLGIVRARGARNSSPKQPGL
jgi:GAF domain-containing protein